MNEKIKSASLATSPDNSFKIDWTNFEAPTPSFIGRKVIDPIKMVDIVPYINWKLFFKHWNYDEKFASVKNISMCGHCKAQWFAAFNEKDRLKAMEASKLYDDAFELLQKIVDIDAEYIKAIVVIEEAYSENNTVYINNTPFDMSPLQEDNDTNTYLNLSNYIVPKETNKKDYIGAFAVTAGAGTEYLLNKYRTAGDEHSVRVLQSLFKVLAEGATEWLHEKVRKSYWGYSSEEDLTIPAMFLSKYSGIRATVGSSELPNQAINLDLHKLLQADEIYISVNKDGETTPTASLFGFFFATHK